MTVRRWTVGGRVPLARRNLFADRRRLAASGARLVSLERGGHLMLGQEDVIRRHVSEFLATPNAAPVAARNAVPA